MPGGQLARVRCLFCQSGSEQSVVRLIQEREQDRALYPQKTESFCRGGVWRDILKPLLPGYVFIYSQNPQPIRQLIQINGVIRLLTYDDDDQEGYLNDRDSLFAHWLLANDGVVQKLNAVREGDFVHIVDGWLKDYNGKVEKINHQNRIACLSLDVIGSTRHIWLGYQYIEKNSTQMA